MDESKRKVQVSENQGGFKKEINGDNEREIIRR